MRFLIVCLCFPFVALAGDAHDHHAHGEHRHEKSAAPAVQMPIDWKPIDARFETTTCEIPCRQPKSSAWDLRRSDTAVELRGAGAPYSEMWRRLGDGRIDYAFAMHDEERVIEYSPIDLQLINKTPDWERLGAVVAAEDLGRLKAGKVGRHAGYATRTYAGNVKGTRIEIVWIPELMLPAKVDSRTAKRRVTVKLLGIEKNANPPMPDPVRERYQRVDFADLGDMEEDPDAQVWIRKAVNAPGHDSHAH